MVVPPSLDRVMTINDPNPRANPRPHPSRSRQGNDRRRANIPRSRASTTSKGKSYSNSLGFVQFNLNKQRQATSDLGSYIKNIDKPIILAQEPHVNGKGVISKGSYCLRARTCKNPRKPIRASIFFHKSMERQVWWKDSISTEDCAIVQTKVDGVDTLIVSCYMDGDDVECPLHRLILRNL